MVCDIWFSSLFFHFFLDNLRSWLNCCCCSCDQSRWLQLTCWRPRHFLITQPEKSINRTIKGLKQCTPNASCKSCLHFEAVWTPSVVTLLKHLKSISSLLLSEIFKYKQSLSRGFISGNIYKNIVVLFLDYRSNKHTFILCWINVFLWLI